MSRASWQHHPEGDVTLEENWLFSLRRERYVSRKSGRAHDHYVVDLADAVTVVAVTRENRVVLVRQFRAGSGRDGFEPPGGLLDEGEDACEAAARELLEETGYAGDTPRVLGTSWACPSILTSRITTVLVTNAARVADPAPERGEELEIDVVPAGAIPRMIRDGRIHHALAVQGLLLWLVSQIPASPLSLPEPLSAKPWQYNLRSLAWVVLYCALGFAVTRWLGPSGTWLAAIVLAMVGPSVVWTLIDQRNRAILLRGDRLTRQTLALRLLAAVGSWTLGLLFAMLVIGLYRRF